MLTFAIAGQQSEQGRRWLAAAYGLATCLVIFSLAMGIEHMAETDPSGLPGVTAVAVKSLMMALTIVGLLGAVAGSAPDSRHRP